MRLWVPLIWTSKRTSLNRTSSIISPIVGPALLLRTTLQLMSFLLANHGSRSLHSHVIGDTIVWSPSHKVVSSKLLEKKNMRNENQSIPREQQDKKTRRDEGKFQTLLVPIGFQVDRGPSHHYPMVFDVPPLIPHDKVMLTVMLEPSH